MLCTAATLAAALTVSATASAQVIISEFLSDDAADGSEIIEIYNAGAVTVDISGYTVADEETLGGGEGAESFPAGTMIGPGEVIVVTSNATELAAGGYPAVAGTQVFENSDSDSDALNDMVDNDTLATGSINLSNGGDEIQLFDATDTLIDGITYGSNSLTGYPNVAAPNDDLSGIRQNLDNTPALDADWMTDQTPTPGAVPFPDPNATCADDPCGDNEDCDDASGSVVCSCTTGFVEDETSACVESCTTAACELLSGEVCDATTELCVCGDGTTDYGDGTCVTPATVTCDEDNLGYGFLGQAGDDTIPNGGCLTDALTNLSDAGLGAVFAAIANGDTDLATPIVVTGAVIAATDDAGGKRQFYIQDSNGTLGTFLNGSAQPPFDLRVGQKVSFEVTKVGIFNSNPQISGATNWSILSDGNFVAAPTPAAAIGEADAASMIHLVGTAVESLDENGETYRVESADGSVSVVVESSDAALKLGSVVEIVAPVEWRGNLTALQVSTNTNALWATFVAPECSTSDDCAASEACVEFVCEALPDECDATNACVGTGEICNFDSDPNTCVCDEDSLFVDDGAGGCLLVDCIAADDCPATGQECTANACACPAGQNLNGDGTLCVVPTSSFAGSLFISEVLFDGTGNPEGEYIEIYNGTGAAIDIGGFQISDGEDTLVIDAGTSIAAGEYVIAAERKTLLQQRFPQSDFTNVQILEWNLTTIALGNGGDEAILSDASGDIVDAVAQGSGVPPAGFPTLAEDAVGKSPGNGDSWERFVFTNTPSRNVDWRVNEGPTPGREAPELDICDETTPCAATGTTCDTDATPNACVCDADSLYIDDGVGGCALVECVDADDCPATGQACNANTCACPSGQIIDNGQCYDPATDACDEDTACTGTGEICNVTGTPNTCDCDADNLFVDDGAGACTLVECIADEDCSATGQTCDSNACECPSGQIVDNGQCYDPATDECDSTNVCVGDNQACDESPTPNVCGCAPGFENTATDGSLVCEPTTTPVQVLITEVQPSQPDYMPWVEYGDDGMPTVETDGQFEYIELYNPTDVAFDMSGFVLTTSPLSDGADQFTFPSGTSIGAGQTLVVAATDDFDMMWNVDSANIIAQGDTAADATLTLAADGDSVYLYTADATDDSDTLDAMSYGTEVEAVFAAGSTLESAIAGFVIERTFDGTNYVDTDTAADWVTGSVPTPGATNDTVSATCNDGSGTLDAGEVCDADLAADVCCSASCLPSVDTAEVCRSTDMCAVTDVSCDGLQGGCIVLPGDIAAAGAACDDGNGTSVDDKCDEDGICIDGTTVDPVCGDDVCEGDEDETSCPQDCTGTGPVCGDDVCEGDEDNASCPQDCDPIGPVCGDGTCDTGETATSCAQDCGTTGPVCGDGTCDSDETATSCPADCGPVCGNGITETGEDCDGEDGCTDSCTLAAPSSDSGCATVNSTSGLAGMLLAAFGLFFLARRRRED